MSIDINWETITSGPDGEALAESIRSFIHDKFQQVTLPGFIRSVEVHSFDFGKICPQLEIKDIGDPLPDFYDDDDDGDGDGDGGADGQHTTATDSGQEPALSQHRQADVKGFGHAGSREHQVDAASLYDVAHSRAFPPQIHTTYPAMRSPFNFADQRESPFPRSGTPGIPGGTSNLSYFHLPLGGLSGTQTPLAAVASGTNYPPGGWSDPAAQGHEQSHTTNTHQRNHADYDSISSTRPSTAASLIIAPQSPVVENGLSPAGVSPHLHSSTQIPHLLRNPQAQTAEPNAAAAAAAAAIFHHQPQPSDLQIITHVKYAGDIRLTLTAEILLDYPMPSFVGIPLRLSITGLTFDGVAVLASIRKNLHFCFLTPEDADVLVGRTDEAPEAESHGEKQKQKRSGGEKVTGGLLEEIRVESEIGRKEGGKQVLKNVGKVERFVLEQVRRIFEDEFVFPSFWTFLV